MSVQLKRIQWQRSAGRCFKTGAAAARQLSIGLFLLAVVFLPCPASAETGVPQFKELGDGKYEIGGIQIDRNSRSVTFPGSVNMVSGIIEYLLVTTGGKAHESFLATEIDPYNLHVAMLLLGVKGSEPAATEPPGAIDEAYLKNAPEPKGPPVLIRMEWKTGESSTQQAVEEFLLYENKPVARGPWTYNGSGLWQGKLLAQEEGSIVALVTDFSALINNPRPGHRDDDSWRVNKEKSPPPGTPLTITIQLEQPPKSPNNP